MRRIADMCPGTAKTDEADAFIIADAVRTMPHNLKGPQVSDWDESTLGIVAGLDLDLARQITQIHPSLERVLGLWMEHDAVLEVLATWPTPAQLKHAGNARVDAKLKKHGPSRHTAWAGTIIEALAAPTVAVVGTDAAGLVIPHLAKQLISLHAPCFDVAAHLEARMEDHPLCTVLTSMPGIAVRTPAIIIAEISGKTATSSAALA